MTTQAVIIEQIPVIPTKISIFLPSLLVWKIVRKETTFKGCEHHTTEKLGQTKMI